MPFSSLLKKAVEAKKQLSTQKLRFRLKFRKSTEYNRKRGQIQICCNITFNLCKQQLPHFYQKSNAAPPPKLESRNYFVPCSPDHPTRFFVPHPSFLFPLFLWGHHFRALFGGGAFNKTLPEPLCIQDSGRSAVTPSEGKITATIGYCDKILHAVGERSKKQVVPQALGMVNNVIISDKSCIGPC